MALGLPRQPARRGDRPGGGGTPGARLVRSGGRRHARPCWRRDLDRVARPARAGPHGAQHLVGCPARSRARSREGIEIRPVGPGPCSGAEEPELTAWVRLRVPQRYDAAVGAILLDAIAPSLYAIMDAPVPIPTIELSAHFVPDAPGTAWTLLSERTVWATERLCVDEAHLWSSEGALLAQARQLRRIRRGVPT
ncbi:MAG: thioesterase family protein [Actinomycetota bacterium]|nr:thioesterase family protein [Actinomycetota bacterium]